MGDYACRQGLFHILRLWGHIGVPIVYSRAGILYLHTFKLALALSVLALRSEVRIFLSR